jgi:hypothetical protein
MTIYIISTPHITCYYAGNMTKKNEVSRARGTYMGVVRCIQRLVCKHEGKRPLGYPRRRGDDNINRLTPNDPYMGRNTPLNFKGCILYIHSINIGTEYFKHSLYSPFFSLQNAVCFTMLTCWVSVLFTFYIQSVLKLKK